MGFIVKAISQGRGAGGRVVTGIAGSSMATLYQTDYHAWAFEQARKLRQGEPIEVENIAEELEDLGRSQRQQLVNRLAVLIAHVLKWEHQPSLRSKGWVGTIREQQKRIERLLDTMPSLQPWLPESIADAYSIAVTFASAETGLVEEDFPVECPYRVDALLTQRYLLDA
jgi:hypothetical protein